MTDRVRFGRLGVAMTMMGGGGALIGGVACLATPNTVSGVVLLVLAVVLMAAGFVLHARVMRWAVEDGVPLGRNGMGGGHGGGDGGDGGG